MEENNQALESEYKKKAISGTIWKFLERFIAQGVTLIVSLVIARILSPEDYSVVSLVTIFFLFANVIISGGLNTALIQKKNSDIEDYSSVLHVSLIISIAIYFILFLTAPFIAKAFNDSSITLIIRIMGLSLPITAIKSIWCAYIYSNLLFKKFFFATLGGTLVSAFVGIYLALKGYGPWALVAQQMTNTIIDTLILIFTARLKIVFRINFKKFGVLFRYGWKIFLSNLIATSYSEISPLIIGIKFSKVDLSFYTKGRSFPQLISQSTTTSLSSVLFPILSKVQYDKKKVLDYTRKYMQLASYVVFPIMLGFFAVADNFVDSILTAKWAQTVYYIRLFCLVSMFDVVAVGNCETIKAIGRSGVYLVMEIIKKSLYLVTIFLFVFFADRPEVLAISAIVCTIIQITVNIIPNRKLIDYRYHLQAIDLLPNLFFAAIMCTAVYFIGYININSVFLLVIQIFAGIIIYIGLSLLFKNKSFIFIYSSSKSFISKMFQKRKSQ